MKNLSYFSHHHYLLIPKKNKALKMHLFVCQCVRGLWRISAEKKHSLGGIGEPNPASMGGGVVVGVS